MIIYNIIAANDNLYTAEAPKHTNSFFYYESQCRKDEKGDNAF